MKENAKPSINKWVDPEDAPEITAELLQTGEKKIADQKISDGEFRQAVNKIRVGRPKLEQPKLLVSIRYDHEIIEYFKATGKGWQTRINEVLSEYVASH